MKEEIAKGLYREWVTLHNRTHELVTATVWLGKTKMIEVNLMPGQHYIPSEPLVYSGDSLYIDYKPVLMKLPTPANDNDVWLEGFNAGYKAAMERAA